MIGTFWNLCRACPSIPIDKNRSEYRSTYQWYEYTGPRQEVVKQAPQLTSPTKLEENGMKGGIQATLININKSDGAKRFKENIEGNVQPEVNIKRNPIFETKEEDYSVTDFVKTDTLNKTTTNPPVRLRLINNYADDYDADTAGIPVKGSRGNTEYRLQFAWPRSKNASETHEEVKAAGGVSRRSTFMAATTTERPPVPVHKKRFLDADKKEGVSELEPLVDENGECENNDEKTDKTQNNKLEFYSEYQKKFRPFSQYDYIAGKFLVRDNTVTPASSLTSGSWYAEVLELRKKAGEYKHRGWGTELVPQHLAEVYNKQIALWEHVSRRSSLSALTLATTTQKPRALTKEEKSKENTRKLAPYRLRETRQASVDRAAAVLRRKTEKNEEIKRHSAKLHKDAIIKYNSEKSSSTAGTPVTPSSTGRPQSESMNSSSPKKHIIRSTSSGSPKKMHQPETRTRPTTLATNAHTRNKCDTSVSTKKKESFKTKVSPATIKEIESEKPSQEPNAPNENRKVEEVDAVEKGIEDSIIDVEHIVKSPPEPTRVKSPEQIMVKSPEPVNWTVPLDTGRTFTVTQNIPDDDVYHHRPTSEWKLHQSLPHVHDDQQDTSSVKTDEAVVSVSNVEPLSDKLCDEVIEPHVVNGNESQSKEPSSEKFPKVPSSHEFSEIPDLPVVERSSSITKSDLVHIVNENSSLAASPVADSDEMKSMLYVEPISLVPDSASVPISERLSPSTEVLDSARNRFEQFWNKPPTFNGKESSI